MTPSVLHLLIVVTAAQNIAERPTVSLSKNRYDNLSYPLTLSLTCSVLQCLSFLFFFVSGTFLPLLVKWSEGWTSFQLNPSLLSDTVLHFV